jgi:murein DD-endopeptidase MepM/ murein hydrolase activator NlpD
LQPNKPQAPQKPPVTGFSKALVYPISPRENFYIAAGFLDSFKDGYPKDRLGRIQYHTGADYNLKTGGDSDLGQPIFAIADGVVSYAAGVAGAGWGNLVQIEHPQFGVWSRYAHLQKILVKQGQRVRAGQQIGTLGKSGLQPFAHLHFDIQTVNRGARFWGATDLKTVKAIHADPDPWLKNRGAVSLGDE